MSFSRKLKAFFRKLFGGDKKEVVIVGDYPKVPDAVTSPGTIAKFVPPEVTVPESPQPVDKEINGWPVGTQMFTPGNYYVPYRGQNGGPFKAPQEAVEWMDAVDRWFINTRESDKALADRVYLGDLENLTAQEAGYLYAANRVFQEATAHRKGNLFFDFGIVTGNLATINRWINEGDMMLVASHLSSSEYVKTKDGGRVKPYVLGVFNQYNI